MILPTWIGKIVKLFRLFLLLNFRRIPGGHDVNQIGGHPGCSFELGWIFSGLRIQFVEEQALALNPNHAVQKRLKNVGDNLAAARFSNDTGGELIRRCVDVIDLDTRKTLLEAGQNARGVHLRQGRIEIERAAFGQCLLVHFIKCLGLGPTYCAKD